MNFLTRATPGRLFLSSRWPPRSARKLRNHPGRTTAGQRFLLPSTASRRRRCPSPIRTRQSLFPRPAVSAQDYSKPSSGIAAPPTKAFAPPQNQLGAMYEHGYGVPGSIPARAATYYPPRPPTRVTPSPIQSRLSPRARPRRSAANYRQSFDWYRKAADQNYPDAEQEVGYFYQCGRLVRQPRDLRPGHRLVSPRSSHGNSTPENPARLHGRRRLGPASGYYVEALSWFYKAVRPRQRRRPGKHRLHVPARHRTCRSTTAKPCPGSDKAAGQGKQQRRKSARLDVSVRQGMQPRFRQSPFPEYRLAADRGQQTGIDNLQALTNILQTRATRLGFRQPIRQRRRHHPGPTPRAHPGSSTAASTNSMPTPLNRTPSPTNSNTPARKTNALGKNLQTPIGTISAVQYRQQAQKYRAEAGNLRDQLAPNRIPIPVLCHRPIPLTH